MRKFNRGETAAIWAYIKDTDGNYASPANGVTITLTDPDGTDQVDAQAMTESDTGKYVYYYNIASDDTLGWWKAAITTQDGTGASAKYVIEKEGFELVT